MLVTNDRHYLFYRYQESLVSPLINPDYIIILEYKLFSQKYRKYHYTLIRLVRNINCWPRYGETATLIHFWWECKMVQPLGKLKYLLNVCLSVYIPKRNACLYPIRDCTKMFRAECLFYYIQKLEITQQKKWLNKLWHNDAMEYCTTVKGRKLCPGNYNSIHSFYILS